MQQQKTHEQQPRQDAQRELQEQVQRTAGVAEALRVYEAVRPYVASNRAQVAWMHYSTGGNQQLLGP